jgi:hypothetical protein
MSDRNPDRSRSPARGDRVRLELERNLRKHPKMTLLTELLELRERAEQQQAEINELKTTNVLMSSDLVTLKASVVELRRVVVGMNVPRTP